MDFDEILKEVGSFGVYQKLIICSVLLPAALPCAFHAYSQLFIAATPQHWCRVPELEPWAQDYPQLVKNLTVPLRYPVRQWRQNYTANDGMSLENVDIQNTEADTASATLEYANCKMYTRNYSTLVRYLEHQTPLELQQQQTVAGVAAFPTTDCQHGWRYDRGIYPHTVVSEWNLVCARSFLVTLALVVFGVAGLLGNYVFGYLQDMWGRRPSFYLYLLVEIIGCAGSAFAWDYASWLGMRFVVGLTVPAILASPYVLAIELVGPERRVFCTIVSNIAYSCGLVMLAGVVYLVRDWRYLSLAVSLPLLMLFSCFFVLPESPRWLLAVGRVREACRVLQTMAHVNGVKTTPEFVVTLQQKLIALERHEAERRCHHASQSAAGRSFGIRDLFRTTNMRRKTLIITLIWFSNTSVYVGLSYYAPALGGDEIWNFFLAGAVELPTYILLWPGLSYIGRRWILCISMLCGGVACVATFFYAQDRFVMLLLYCVGKMGISSAFVVLPLLASELYPTVVRGLGMSFSSVIAMIGPIVIPLINHMGQHMLVLPLMVMGGLLIIGGFASLFLPETRGRNLPQTIEDGDAVPLMFFYCCCCPPAPPQPSRSSSKASLRREVIVSEPRVVCCICKNEIKSRN